MRRIVRRDRSAGRRNGCGGPHDAGGRSRVAVTCGRRVGCACIAFLTLQPWLGRQADCGPLHGSDGSSQWDVDVFKGSSVEMTDEPILPASHRWTSWQGGALDVKP